MIFDTTGNLKISESCEAIFLLIKESDIIKILSSYFLISSLYKEILSMSSITNKVSAFIDLTIFSS